jgi:hypothetical protein
MNPPKGYYRNLLKDNFPHVRIAFTHTPIFGCTIIDPKEIINILDSSNDIHAIFYSNGLKNGTLVTIIENSFANAYRNNGELYFTN